jgi:Fe-S cluster biosynthesis and repair protein YggX
MEVKVINEYRLSFLDPQHREMLQRACFDFLGLPQGSPATE